MSSICRQAFHLLTRVICKSVRMFWNSPPFPTAIHYTPLFPTIQHFLWITPHQNQGIAKKHIFRYNWADNIDTMSLNIPENLTVIYVSRDVERAAALIPSARYKIVTNDSPDARRLIKSSDDGLIIPGGDLLDTRELLDNDEVQQFIDSQENPHIIVFKPTERIERMCDEYNWTLINPSAELASKVEEKISQVEWLGELTSLLPKHHIATGKELEWNSENYVVQFNRAHTGTGTLVMTSQSDVDELKEKFPNRPVRVSSFIEGTMLTSNNVVAENIHVGNINYQITGLQPFTENSFATVGNDFGLPSELLTDEQRKEYANIVTQVGNKLKKDGWKGLFGVDVILEKETGKLYLIEINARQPASTTFESSLQKEDTIFEAHLSALLGQSVEKITEINDGAQVIIRNSASKIYSEADRTDLKKKFEDAGFAVWTYNNQKVGSDILRIQSEKNIMASHNELNDVGNTITDILK
jgi:predicted ATP-grasp superfamily ATP-dependent carboligase